jgi:hypothetical protein
LPATERGGARRVIYNREAGELSLPRGDKGPLSQWYQRVAFMRLHEDAVHGEGSGLYTPFNNYTHVTGRKALLLLVRFIAEPAGTSYVAVLSCHVLGDSDQTYPRPWPGWLFFVATSIRDLPTLATAMFGA